MIPLILENTKEPTFSNLSRKRAFISKERQYRFETAVVNSVLLAGKCQLSVTNRYISLWIAGKHSTVDKWGHRVEKREINEREGD